MAAYTKKKRKPLRASLRKAAVKAGAKARDVSFNAWCWIKIKTAWRFWFALTALVFVWYIGWQQPAQAKLDEARDAYKEHANAMQQLQAEIRELHDEYLPLKRNDPYAWRLLARTQLGWRLKSEIHTRSRSETHQPNQRYRQQ